MLKDNHIHFTGSLHPMFILERALNNKDKFINHEITKLIFKTEHLNLFLKHIDIDTKKASILFSRNLTKVYSESSTENYLLFNKIYNYVKEILMYDNLSSYQFYKNGMNSILENCLSIGISEVDIIAGVKNDMESTIERLDGMIDSINEKSNRINSKIRITFIRDEEGKFRNLNTDCSLSQIFLLLNNYKSFSQHVSGFDISGVETYTSNSIKNLLTILDQIRDYNKYLRSKKRKVIPTSIHLGESFLINYQELFSALDVILEYGITKICHGTILWIDNYFTDPHMNIQRLQLLNKISRKRISFEICPTANLLLTPLKNLSNINFKLLNNMNIDFSINSDNMTIFNTNISSELKKIQPYI